MTARVRFTEIARRKAAAPSTVQQSPGERRRCFYTVQSFQVLGGGGVCGRGWRESCHVRSALSSMTKSRVALIPSEGPCRSADPPVPRAWGAFIPRSPFRWETPVTGGVLPRGGQASRGAAHVQPMGLVDLLDPFQSASELQVPEHTARGAQLRRVGTEPVAETVGNSSLNWNSFSITYA